MADHSCIDNRTQSADPFQLNHHRRQTLSHSCRKMADHSHIHNSTELSAHSCRQNRTKLGDRFQLNHLTDMAITFRQLSRIGKSRIVQNWRITHKDRTSHNWRIISTQTTKQRLQTLSDSSLAVTDQSCRQYRTQLADYFHFNCQTKIANALRQVSRIGRSFTDT